MNTRNDPDPPSRPLRGGCHCGAVRFEVNAAGRPVVFDCNCSICRRCGYLHLIVPRERFRLLGSWDDLTTYTFNTGVAKHYFCKTCGIKSFYIPRSNPGCYSVNARCIEDLPASEMEIVPFDGRNWEASMQHGGGSLVSD